jgi:hypothetical protein
MSETTQRPGSVPASINPKEYRALEDLRSHCRREGVTLIDRVYADAAKMYQLLKTYEDLYELNQPAPAGKTHAQKFNTYTQKQNAIRGDEEML